MPETDELSPIVTDILHSAVSRQVAEQKGLRDSIDGFRADLASASADVQGLAAAILELNSALRDRFEALDGGVVAVVRDLSKKLETLEGRLASFATTVGEGLRELATSQRDALQDLGGAVTSALANVREDVRDAVADRTAALVAEIDTLGVRLSNLDRFVESSDTIAGGLAEVRDRVSETSDVVGYLRDQAEDLDRVLESIGATPARVESVLSQALRRALTVRAGLTAESERALGEAMSPVVDRVDKLLEEIDAAGETVRDGRSGLADEVRRLALGQTELSSRLDGLTESFTALAQSIQDDRRERDWALAEALERGPEGEWDDEEEDDEEEDDEQPPRARRRSTPRPRPTTARSAAKLSAAGSSVRSSAASGARARSAVPKPRSGASRSAPSARSSAAKPATLRQASAAKPATLRQASAAKAATLRQASAPKTTVRKAATSKTKTTARKTPARAQQTTPQPSRRKRTYIPL